MKKEEIIKKFIHYIQIEKQYSSETIRAYENDLKEFNKIAIGKQNKSLLTVNEIDVENYLNYMHNKGDQRNTILRKVSSIRSFYNYLIKSDITKNQPFEYVHLKKKQNRLPKFLYPNEIKELFKSAHNGTNEALIPRNIAILELLFSTGLRVSECAALTISHIDFNNRIMDIWGKGNKQRFVPFSQETLQALRVYIRTTRQTLMNDYHQDHGYLFINHHANPITTRGIEYILDAILKNSSINGNIYPHMFRHTFATDMLNNGADLRSVQELLGHSSLSTTQIYTHVTKENLLKNYNQFFPRSKE
ncbi:tyrosine recombinase XerC [Nicoliella spurrieriana]|uniref:Tyrosine recombinase XerC n=1 Tax=Nicoliella spurrieriana TaxID=2925830 RepID=A0A976RRJ1_9LACO|nr:site-specific tyrosine recombinase/integron integrase [Nicoliella spurrieriana]UQS86577.1 tyrosine recombinase XerC [Nicoliella spurrieriana]